MASDASRVVFAGENPLILLYRPGGDDLVAVASLWRARHTPRGPGISLLVWADPGEGRRHPPAAAILSDNADLARWLWTTFNSRWEPLLGRGLEQAAPQPATFAESQVDGVHRLEARSKTHTVELVWRRPQPAIWTDTRPYEYTTTAVIVPCLDADIVLDGTAVAGEVRPHDDVFASSAVLAFCETWLASPDD